MAAPFIHCPGCRRIFAASLEKCPACHRISPRGRRNLRVKVAVVVGCAIALGITFYVLAHSPLAR